MKITVQGHRLYVDGLLFSHGEVKDGYGDKSFSGEVEPRYAHSVGRELLHVDGLGWLGAAPECAIRVGRVVRSDGSVMPCSATEARLMGVANWTAERASESLWRLKNERPNH